MIKYRIYTYFKFKQCLGFICCEGETFFWLIFEVKIINVQHVLHCNNIFKKWNNKKLPLHQSGWSIKVENETE